MARVGALLFRVVFIGLPLRTLGSEFLKATQTDSSSSSSSEPRATVDPQESSALAGIPELEAVNESMGDPEEEKSFLNESMGDPMQENSSLQLSSLVATEAAVQGSGKHFYAQVCAAMNCHRGLPLSHVRNFGGAAVGKAGGKCVVAFRGTTNIAGVMQDVGSFALVPFDHCPGCRVGAGFKSGYNAVAGQIKGALRSSGCHSVAVTGHSLGAAKAILCMYDLAKSGFHITTSYVFGEPRVGNGAFVASFHSVVHAAVFHVAHGQDPIVRLGGPGAQHVGSEIYEPGNSRSTDHLHYAGVDMTRCMPGLPAKGGATVEKAGEKAARRAEHAAHCCLRFEWSCCIPR